MEYAWAWLRSKLNHEVSVNILREIYTAPTFGERILVLAHITGLLLAVCKPCG